MHVPVKKKINERLNRFVSSQLQQNNLFPVFLSFFFLVNVHLIQSSRAIQDTGLLIEVGVSTQEKAIRNADYEDT